MAKKILLLLLVALFQFSAFSQQKVQPSKVLWYDIETAMQAYEKQPRPLLIDFYTDWCGWCKHMMKTTFAHQYIANYINSNFYPVRFDAQGNDTIQYKGKTYVNKQALDSTNRRPNHQWAIEMMKGRMGFPTIVYVTLNGQAHPVPGYKNVKDIEPILYFFAERAYKNQDFRQFLNYFKLSFYPADSLNVNKKALTQGKVNWMSFEEAFAKQKTNPKKVFVEIFAPMYISCRMMDSATYSNPHIAKYLNENFYAVKLHAATQDTIKAFGKTFANQGKGNYALHPLAAQLLTNREILFPSFAIFDEKGQVINTFNGYASAKAIEPYLKFFNESSPPFQQKWGAFLKEFQGKVSTLNIK